MKDTRMIVSLILICPMLVAAAEPKGVVVKVNGAPITKADVLFAASQKGLTDEQLPKEEPKIVDQLIERQLIRAFLESQKIEPNAEELQFQIGTAKELIRKHGEDPEKLLAKLGYTQPRLKAELGLPLAWKVYVQRTLTDEQIKGYFKQHKQELDGTQLRGRQIILKLPKPAEPADVAAKKMVLTKLRDEIKAGKISFEEAAKTHSESPSRENGGDVGFFGRGGAKLPSQVTQAAFSLKIGEVSEPIVTPFGVHLIEVTERHPGDFSLEDVRPVIVEELAQELWKTTAASKLQTAKIERF